MKSTLTAIALALTALTSAAQGFPSKNVTIVVPTAAGGGTGSEQQICRDESGKRFPMARKRIQ